MSELESSVANDPDSACDVYHHALKCAFVFQVFFTLLACLMLDGGIFRRAFCVVSIGFWVMAVGVLIARPAEWGLRYLRYGVVVGFGLVTIIAVYWDEWLRDVVGG